jgi:hypothetical protein
MTSLKILYMILVSYSFNAVFYIITITIWLIIYISR